MFYTGVVENRLDPLKLGRCQVRIFGLHSNNISELATEDLPWAFPIQPITSAAMNGIGHTPLGPVEGTWVVIVFRDTDEQQPLILGTLGGVPQSSAPGSATPEATPQNVITDSSGNVVTDGSGNPVLQGSADEKKEEPKPTKTVDTKGWSLGQSSEKFESGGRGPGTINNYANSGDFGGASYGTYQFASFLPVEMPSGKKRSGWESSAMKSYLGSSRFSAKFSGLTPATDAFDSAWKKAAQQYPKEFASDQHDYIKKNFYDVLYSKVQRAGVDLSANGPAVQDCIWSTAVQYGSGAVTKITRALGGKTKLTDVEFVTLVQDSKASNASNDFSKSSSAIQESVVSRAKAEKDVLLKLARSGAESDVTNKESQAKPSDGDPVASEKDPAKFDITKENANTTQNSGLAFLDPNAKYPKKDFLNEPDTNRLARNMKIASTIIAAKETNLLKGAQKAGGGTWAEPQVPFAGKYPFNHIYESESGHMLEFDDTPEAQRIQLYHRAGTYIEIDRNGRQVNHIIGDSFSITERNGYIYIAGKCNVTIDGSANVKVGGNADIEVDGDVTANVGNDLTVSVSGGISMAANEDFDLKVGGKINMTAGSDINIKAGGVGYYTSGGNLELNAGGLANLDGSLVQLGMGAASASSSNATSPGAAKTVNETEFETLQSSYRGEEDSFFFETPEEAEDANAKSQHHTEMVNSGKADSGDLKKEAIPGEADDSDTKTPDPSIKADCAAIAGLTTYPDTLLLSPNFTLGKVSSRAAATQIPVKGQYGLQKEEIICNLQFLCLNILEPIKKLYPDMIVTSGFRDYGKSKTVSQHCLGEAVDLQFTTKSNADYYNIAVALKNAIPFDQLLLEYKNYGTGKPWIHVSLKRIGSNRKQTLTMFNDALHSQGFTKLA